MSNNSTTQRFIDALQETERTRDPEKVSALFAPDAELHSYTRDQRGSNAAVFWKEYLDAFQSVQSRFTRVQDEGKAAVLEWESEGALPSGEPIRYEGVTLLEFDGDRVSRFRTYYDSAAFLPEGSKHQGTEGKGQGSKAADQRPSGKSGPSAKSNPR